VFAFRHHQKNKMVDFYQTKRVITVGQGDVMAAKMKCKLKRDIKRTKAIEGQQHKARCIICNVNPQIKEKIEEMWVAWYTPKEILDVFPALVNPQNASNGRRGSSYKNLHSFTLGLQSHAHWSRSGPRRQSIEERRMSNWQGANRQIIRLGQLDIRSLSAKERNQLASKAIEAETKMAMPPAQQPVNVQFQFANVSTATVEERAKELLQEVAGDKNAIQTGVKVEDNEAQNEDE
jgi:hypothetical protein